MQLAPSLVPERGARKSSHQPAKCEYDSGKSKLKCVLIIIRPQKPETGHSYLPACENLKYNTQQQKKHSRGAGLRRRQSAAWGKRKLESVIRETVC